MKKVETRLAATFMAVYMDLRARASSGVSPDVLDVPEFAFDQTHP